MTPGELPRRDAYSYFDTKDFIGRQEPLTPDVLPDPNYQTYGQVVAGLVGETAMSVAQVRAVFENANPVVPSRAISGQRTYQGYSEMYPADTKQQLRALMADPAFAAEVDETTNTAPGAHDPVQAVALVHNAIMGSPRSLSRVRALKGQFTDMFAGRTKGFGFIELNPDEAQPSAADTPPRTTHPSLNFSDGSGYDADRAGEYQPMGSYRGDSDRHIETEGEDYR